MVSARSADTNAFHPPRSGKRNIKEIFGFSLPFHKKFFLQPFLFERLQETF